MAYNFPFTIKDVCSLIPITIRLETDSSIYVDCPLCNKPKKGKMNINFDKNAYRCNRCSGTYSSGGMLDLYRIFGNSNLTSSEAYKEIVEKLELRGAVTTHNAYTSIQSPKPKPDIIKADIRSIDHTYRNLLALLRLSDKHVKELHKRGLDTYHIKRIGFRSVPISGKVHLIRALLNCGNSLQGVPGFYKKTTYGKWVFLVRSVRGLSFLLETFRIEYVHYKSGLTSRLKMIPNTSGLGVEAKANTAVFQQDRQ